MANLFCKTSNSEAATANIFRIGVDQIIYANVLLFQKEDDLFGKFCRELSINDVEVVHDGKGRIEGWIFPARYIDPLYHFVQSSGEITIAQYYHDIEERQFRRLYYADFDHAKETSPKNTRWTGIYTFDRETKQLRGLLERFSSGDLSVPVKAKSCLCHHKTNAAKKSVRFG